MNLATINNVTLDGYTEDVRGNFDFTEPSDEVFDFITELLRSFGTYLLGRRMYETMAVWETDPALAAASARYADFATVWQAADKVVYSTTLETVPTAHTTIERSFDAAAVRALKDAATRDLTVGGPNLAAQAHAAGLLDEYHLFVAPVLIGDGKPGLAVDGHAQLELLDERRFDSGTVYLRYGARR